jgi:hypothetical protein
VVPLEGVQAVKGAEIAVIAAEWAAEGAVTAA